MDYLKYGSDEMFSATELVRKSKMVFDKIKNHDIDKAVILRDGKPSFMLLDFEMYEKMMREYEQLCQYKTTTVLDNDVSLSPESKQADPLSIKETACSEASCDEMDQISFSAADDEEFLKTLMESDK